MEGYLLPLAAAFLWAVSAPVVNVGLRRLPQEHRVACIGIGLMSSLAAGTIAMVAANGVAMLQPSSVDGAAVLSGCLPLSLVLASITSVVMLMVPGRSLPPSLQM